MEETRPYNIGRWYEQRRPRPREPTRYERSTKKGSTYTYHRKTPPPLRSSDREAPAREPSFGRLRRRELRLGLQRAQISFFRI